MPTKPIYLIDEVLPQSKCNTEVSLGKCSKERLSPPENILKFNVPGGLMPLFRAFAKNMAPVKTTLRFSREVRPLYS
jgi:hypothetical protein